MFPNVEHRGRDSFGWLHRKQEGAIQLRKFAESASEGLEKVSSKHRFGIPDDAQWWIGHVRLATHGHQSYSHNNHPIVHGDILGVHNGVCYNYRDILKDTGRQHAKAEVDSEAIFAAINKYGIEDGLDKLDALAAVVFVDRTDPDKVYFATCDANPLIVARSKGGATYYASESWILEELGIEWEEEPWKMGDYTIYTLDKGVEVDYVHYADPKEKTRNGWGSYMTNYSSSNRGYANSGYSGSRWQDDDDDGWESYGVGQQYNLRTGEMKSSTTTTPTTSPSYYEDDVECLNCSWTGDEWDCDDGLCPQCGSYAYIIPRGLLIKDSEKRPVVRQLDEAVVLDGTSPPWISDMAAARLAAGAPTEVVLFGGRGEVVTKQDYDNLKTARKVLEGVGVNDTNSS